MARKPQTPPPPQANQTSYLMHLPGGKMRRITVPSEWKVTFGPLVPPREGNDRYQQKTFALRFYEGETKQRALFTDVLSFYDESLAIQERVTKVKQQVVNKNAPGGKTGMVVEARITEWRDPLAPEAESTDGKFLQIEQPDEDF